MRYPYAVKYNGKVYLANTEIPEKEERAKEVTEPKKAVTTSKKKKAAKGDE